MLLIPNHIILPLSTLHFQVLYDKKFLMQYFNIQMASQLSGVATATIRAWEKRYQVVTPARAENMHRLYSETDIEKLSLLAKLTDFGQNIGKIARLDREELIKVYSTLFKRPYQQEDLITFPKEKIHYEKTLSNLSLAISTFKLDVISHELKKIKEALGPRDIALNILSPLIKLMEHQFNIGKITSAHQFTLNEMISCHFSSLLSEKESPPESPKLILATPTHATNELNILAIALLCLHHKRDFLYLGHSVPQRVLTDITNEIKNEVVILTSNQYQLSDLVNLDQYLDELHRLLRHLPQFLIYGPDKVKRSIMRQNCLVISELQDMDIWLRNN